MPSTEVITLKLVAQDLASGNISKAVAGIDKMAQRGGIAGGVIQGVGMSFGMMLNPMTLAMRGMMGVTSTIGGMVSAAADFDAAMTESLAIMGDVSDAMRDDMEDAARDVAKTTTYSAKEAAEAYYFLASAGLDAQQSVAAMPKVAKFAQAGMFDLAQATDLLTDAQSALGLTVDDTAENMRNMEYVSDVLVKANTLANASVEQFSEALTNKGAAALRLVGKELTEGAALLAAWADQGVKGAEAGTRLDIVLRDLQNAAIKNADVFDKYGIAVYDTQGEMRNLADIIGDMETAFGGLSDQAVRAGLTQLGFQSRTVSATASLIGMSDKVRQYEAELSRAQGTTDVVANKQLKSFSARLDVVGDKAEVLGARIGEHIIGPLEGIVTAADFAIDALDMVMDPDRAELLDAGWDMSDLRKQAKVFGEDLDDLNKRYLAVFDAPSAKTSQGAVREMAREIQMMGGAALYTTSNIFMVGKAASKIPGATGRAIAGFEEWRQALKAFNKELDDFDDVKNIDNVNAAIKRTREAMERAAEKSDSAAWARRKARLEELRDERAKSNQADIAMKQWEKRRQIESRAEEEAQAARKAQNREIRMVAKNHEESTKTIRRMLREQGGDMDKVREKLKKTGDKATTAAGQMDDLATEAKNAADETRLADDALKGVTTTATALDKVDPVVTVTADIVDAEAKILHLRALISSLDDDSPYSVHGRGAQGWGWGTTPEHPHQGGMVNAGQTVVVRQNEALVTPASRTAVVPLDGPGAPRGGGPTIHIHGNVYGDADAIADHIGPALSRWMAR